MWNLKKIEKKYTVVFTIILAIACVLISDLPLRNIYGKILKYPDTIFLEGITLQVTLSILCYLLLKHIDNVEFLGLRFEHSIKSIWVIWPLIAFMILNSIDSIGEFKNINISFITIILYLMLFLSTGLFEEILVRGVILKLLLNKYGETKSAIYKCSILSSIIFGVLHINNFITGDKDFITTLSQIIFAIFIGVLFAAVFLRTRTLWTTIILHGLIDAVGSIRLLGANSIIEYEAIVKTCITLESCIENIIITLPFLLCGLFFLRKVKKYWF